MLEMKAVSFYNLLFLFSWLDLLEEERFKREMIDLKESLPALWMFSTWDAYKSPLSIRGNQIEIQPCIGLSLVDQWLTVCLTMQGTLVQSLAQEDPTCLWATKSVSQLLKPRRLKPVLCDKRSHCNEESMHHN